MKPPIYKLPDVNRVVAEHLLKRYSDYDIDSVMGSSGSHQRDIDRAAMKQKVAFGGAEEIVHALEEWLSGNGSPVIVVQNWPRRVADLDFTSKVGLKEVGDGRPNIFHMSATLRGMGLEVTGVNSRAIEKEREYHGDSGGDIRANIYYEVNGCKPIEFFVLEEALKAMEPEEIEMLQRKAFYFKSSYISVLAGDKRSFDRWFMCLAYHFTEEGREKFNAEQTPEELVLVFNKLHDLIQAAEPTITYEPEAGDAVFFRNTEVVHRAKTLDRELWATTDPGKRHLSTYAAITEGFWRSR